MEGRRTAMNRPLSARRRRLLPLPLEQLVKLAGGIVCPPEERPERERVFTPWVTFWMFLGQVCSAAPTCREALRQGQAWLGSPKVRQKVSSNTAAYCQARARLPQAHLDTALQGTLTHLDKREKALRLGRPVRVVDGSSCSMPDTPENQARYPQPGRQKPGCGFPVMRFVAVFSLATGALLGVAQGALAVHERTLWRRLWDLLKRGDIALADRGFCSYADYCLLLQRGVDSVMRLHQRRSKGVKKRKRLGKNDWLVEWIKTAVRPQWMTPEQWKELPDTLLVRHVKIHVRIKGFRTQVLTIATTLCDADAYPAQVLADLYRQRWRAELFLRDIKITLGMDVLRCKTPALIQKEFTMHLIAYNLVRALMLEAATRYGRNGLDLSLAGALATVRQWAPALAARPKNQRRAALDAFFQCIATDTVPKRPNRLEPRARKRRPKNYPLLNKPRHQFREIQHRNKYKKALT
jgi:hypothetical protein